MSIFLTSKKYLFAALGFLKLSTGLAQVAPVATATTSGKIPIDATRWYAQSNSPNNILALFDGSITTGSITGWGKLIPSYDTYYTFQPGEAMSIESIRFYDGGSNNMTDPMTLSVITNSGQRIAIGKYSGGYNYRWEGPNPNDLYNFKLPTPVSNIRALVITATWGYPTELELYGTYVAGTPLPTTDQTGVAVQKKIKLAQEMGVNGFEWDMENPVSPGEVDVNRLAAVKHFTGFRHYMDWRKIESAEGSFTYNPVHSGGWNYDVMYQRLKAEGVEVLACLQSMPDWMLDSYPSADRDAENVPVRYGRDFSDPNSYIEQARVAFQYVARYGANMNVNPALLRVDTSIRWFGDPANQIKIGLGYVKYIECGNERDKWWKGRKAYQTGFEYAANLSAFYDGNKNTMGAGIGVKNADPSIQVVMAGLASPNPDYVRGMIDWCRQNRGLKADGTVNLCWDVINYHLYSNDASTSQSGNSTRGSAPEVSNAGQVAQSFIKMANQYANNMPVWVTETGYDLNQGSPLKAIAIGSRSVQQTEADWTLRTALLYARWGVERTFFYQLYDDNPTNPIQFGSSGLINSDLSPRPAAIFLRQANALLGSYVYTGTLSSDPIVDRYQANDKTFYALVVPDEKGRTASYTLDLGTADSARIYQPQEGRTTMLATRVKTQSGKVTLAVTETPQFVTAGGGTTTTPTATACSGTGSIGWEQWTNVSGTSIAAIPVTTTATKTAVLTKLESALNIGDNYGARIRGYICPPQSGNYTFQIAGDDNCQLWLSTDDTPGAKVQLASVSGWTNPGEWGKYSSQKSGTVNLVAGRRYYVEVLHKEGD
ncbi:MAG: PA14 domain-containing protein, partial [Janthinobacterium lividum]